MLPIFFDAVTKKKKGVEQVKRCNSNLWMVFKYFYFYIVFITHQLYKLNIDTMFLILSNNSLFITISFLLHCKFFLFIEKKNTTFIILCLFRFPWFWLWKWQCFVTKETAQKQNYIYRRTTERTGSHLPTYPLPWLYSEGTDSW